ncbi:MAG: sugar transferase [Desulfotalea sp.]|nr:MAG: sugar transferase [Desulfotalea sp.]
MKRFFDIICSLAGLLFISPVLLVFMLLIWLQDFHSPFYIAQRVGRNGTLFNMIKLRSMVAGADKSGIDSTAAGDLRITKIGRMIRRYKLDELSQLWNVLFGQMSLVGPRPNVSRDVDLYTAKEMGLLEVCPGITDISSIVFSDEGDILEGADDPDLLYNQIIRPWKSRLGIFYVQHHGLLLDIKLILLTIMSLISRRKALEGVAKILQSLGADQRLIAVARRNTALQPCPPPGAEAVVTSRIVVK